MKTIGMLGGMSWESTEHYYRLVNQMVKERLGGFHSARIAMVSVDFHEIEALMREDQWNTAGRLLAKCARRVEAAGGEFLLICTNTLHKVAPVIEEDINIPVLHIADPTAEIVKQSRIKTVGLLGTNFTMEEDFYKGRLAQKHKLNVIIPGEPDRRIIHRVIFEELCMGVVKEDSRKEYIRIIEQMAKDGAEGVILGCTEIAMLVGPENTDTPLFDTTAIHAAAAVDLALA